LVFWYKYPKLIMYMDTNNKKLILSGVIFLVASLVYFYLMGY